MKKLIIFFMAIFIFSSSIIAQAEMPVEDAIQKQQIDKSKELSAIQNAINANSSEPKQFEMTFRNRLQVKEQELSFGTPYKVYIVSRDFINTIINKKQIADLEKSYYLWEVPIIYQGKPIDTFQVALFQNKYQIVRLGGYLSPEDIVFSCNPQMISQVANNNSIKTADTFIHYRVAPFESDYLCFVDGSNEYFYPLGFFGQKESFGLSSKTFYSRQQIEEKIEPVVNQWMNHLGR